MRRADRFARRLAGVALALALTGVIVLTVLPTALAEAREGQLVTPAANVETADASFETGQAADDAGVATGQAADDATQPAAVADDDAFWQAELESIVSAPCPDGATGGGTPLVLFVGADAEWTMRLSDAMQAHGERCASATE